MLEFDFIEILIYFFYGGIAVSAKLNMNVHNVMEEYVTANINSIYDQLVKSNTAWLSCNCESCRLDAISYVLNRIEPHYIVSGRGAVYTAQKLEDAQLKADINALSIEAIRIISSVQRPYHKISSKLKAVSNNTENTKTPYFNFPVLSGAVYDGETFEPIVDAEITLKDKHGNVIMQDFSWSNPSKTYKTTKGSFSFWPESIESNEENESKRFSFTVEATAKGYNSVKQGCEIVLMSEKTKQEQISHSLTMKIPDLILFKEEN